MPASLGILLMEYDNLINLGQCILCGIVFFKAFSVKYQSAPSYKKAVANNTTLWEFSCEQTTEAAGLNKKNLLKIQVYLS